jgi:hypothetical protein
MFFFPGERSGSRGQSINTSQHTILTDQIDSVGITDNFELKRYLNKGEQCIYDNAIEWADSDLQIRKEAGILFLKEFEARAAFYERTQKESPTDAIRLQEIAKSFSQLITITGEQFLKQALVERNLPYEKILSRNQLHAIARVERRMMGASTPSSQKATTSASQPTPSSKKRASQTSPKTPSQPPKKRARTPLKDREAKEREEARAAEKAKMTKKQSQATEFEGKFNVYLKKARDKNLKGMCKVNPGILYGPFPGTEDRVANQHHVEEIASEMRSSNIYATPSILIVAIVGNKGAINEFNQLWLNHQGQPEELEHSVNAWLYDNQGM